MLMEKTMQQKLGIPEFRDAVMGGGTFENT
jgi:hypothetical protein